MSEARGPARLGPGGAAAWGIVGLVFALAPIGLFAVAAVTNVGGPATSVLVFAAPVLAATVGVVFVIRLLLRGERKSWAFSVVAVAIFAGMIGYVLWLYLALLALQFGNGPL